MWEKMIWALICFGIPLLGLVWSVRKGRGYALSFLAGAGVFALFQLVLRLPLLERVLPYQEWFLRMQYQLPLWITYLFYALTAGLFEEAGRWVGFTVTGRRRRSWQHGVLFGLGHGGLEAAWIGWQLAVYPGVVSEANYLISGFERMCTMVVQVGLALVVLEGIRKRQARWLFLAIGLHTGVDLVCPMLLRVSLAASEGILLPFAAGAGLWIWRCKKIWNRGEIA